MRHEDIEELAAWSALNRTFGFSPKTGLLLIRHFGSPMEVFRADKGYLAEMLAGYPDYAANISLDKLKREEEELRESRQDGAQFICIDDERYPKLLKECTDPPIGLYYKGVSPIENVFEGIPAIAVVGTRDLTSYGREWCTRLVAALSKARIKPLIVSGLAIGTDITAHTEALDNALPTVAVMPTGIDDVYPFRHGSVADRISRTEGCGLVTDYPPHTVPKAINFIRRNRIIAGLSKATILIESKMKGGGLITCRLAYSYNRDVYALPGRIDDICSAGCNELLRTKTAEPVTDINKLIESLALFPGNGEAKRNLRSAVYDRYREDYGIEAANEMADIADTIRKNRNIRLDDLCSLTGLEYSRIAYAAGIMECDGIIVTDLLQCCSINPKFM